jgi:sirohydrochlorin cobaltochelatase
MKIVVVLAMHGAPPNDFPRPEMLEFFGLHARMERATPEERATLAERYVALESKMRTWPRTAQNDPFYAASQDLATQLAQATGYKVLVGFNEFCAPSLEQALEDAVARGAEKVVVTTPMMTQGGEHAQKEIPALVAQAQERHPQVTLVYAWPFETSKVAAFLAAQIERFV